MGRILYRRKKFYSTDPPKQMVKKQQINFLKEKVFILGFSAVNIFKRGSRCFGTASTLNYFLPWPSELKLDYEFNIFILLTLRADHTKRLTYQAGTVS